MDVNELVTKSDLEDAVSRLLQELKKQSASASTHLTTPSYYSNKEIRRLFQISDNTLRKLRFQGILPYKKFGTIIRYSAKDVENALSRNSSSTIK